jgi:hypothetical protein
MVWEVINARRRAPEYVDGTILSKKIKDPLPRGMILDDEAIHPESFRASN